MKRAILPLVLLLAFLFFQAPAKAEPLNGQYTIEAIATPVEGNPYAWTFTYKIKNNTEMGDYTGLDGFYIMVPKTAIITNIQPPPPLFPPGEWIYFFQEYYPPLDSAFYRWLKFWGADIGSVYPVGSTATFSFTAHNVNLGANGGWVISYLHYMKDDPDPNHWYKSYSTEISGPIPLPATQECTITQLTNTPAGLVSHEPKISGDGSKIVFRSNANITGLDPGPGSEVFLYDVSLGTFTKATDTTGSSMFDLSISPDATKIAFVSDFDNNGANFDRNLEVFFYDVPQNKLTQVTQVTTMPENFRHSRGTSISSDGKIAFYSDADLTGANPDHNREIYLYDPSTGLTQVTQVASTSYSSVGPSISANGTRVAFASNADLIEGSNFDHNQEIFLYDTANKPSKQVTISNRFNAEPSISADGTKIAFPSSANLTGGNPDLSQEIFLYDIANDTFTQVTNTTMGDAYEPSINADGSKIAFYSGANFTGANPKGNFEIFLYDTKTNFITQMTSSVAGSSSKPSISADGAKIAFASTANITGMNPDGSTEIFLINCAADADGDGVPDSQDACPDENAFGFDVDGDGCIDSTSGLGTIIGTLVQEGVIAPELQTSLMAKVNNAENSATKGNICTAVNQLGALKNQVNAQRGKKISDEAANRIITYTNSVIAHLLSQLPPGMSC